MQHALSRVRGAITLLYGPWRRADTQGVETTGKKQVLALQERPLPLPVSPPGALASAFRVWRLRVMWRLCGERRRCPSLSNMGPVFLMLAMAS